MVTDASQLHHKCCGKVTFAQFSLDGCEHYSFITKFNFVFVTLLLHCLVLVLCSCILMFYVFTSNFICWNLICVELM